MATEIVNYMDWVLEVDRKSTEQAYHAVSASGADTCSCSNCKNYVAFRDKVFPAEIKELLDNLGIDYRKEVEIISWEVLPGGLRHIGGWFHFKGRILKGKDYRIPLPGGGYTFDLTKVAENFSIGFAKGSDLSFFEDKADLVQVEFDTNIPWVIDKALQPPD